MTAMLEVADLGHTYQAKDGAHTAIAGLTFTVGAGELVCVVGPSGCGKSTTGRAILQLHKPTSGSVKFEGRELTTLRGRGLRQVRKDMQIVFQDPYASLNPRWQINELISEPFKIHGEDG
ncbi:ATP-binding cassette domain-containing protein, partial [Saccharothrix sp. MB29]|nr:ATP-binding cassette domain-containing protein [Saccharothrix sp. MB29]